MNPTPNKSEKSKTKANPLGGGKSSHNNSASSWCLILVLVIVFFSSGVYVGSLVLSETDLASQNALGNGVGLPGTYNIVNVIKEEADYLNKEAHDFLRKEFVHEQLPPKLTASSNFRKVDPEMHELPTVVKREAKFAEPIVPHILEEKPAEAQVAKLFTVSQGSSYPPSFVSLKADDNCLASAPSSLDSENILVAGWIYLDPSSSHDKDMRTIFSNKLPGCEYKSETNGISLYVNGWQTKDHKVYMEYGGRESGCQKVYTDSEISLGVWTHVATYVTTNHVYLFVNGELMNKKEIYDPHIVQKSNPFRFGSYSSDASYPFYGNLSHFVFSQEYYQEPEVTSLVKALHSQGTGEDFILKNTKNKLLTYYRFDYQKKEKVVKDLIGSTDANYMCLAGNAAGLKIPLVDGVNDRPVTEQMKAESDRQGQIRKEKIKEGMRHVWNGYRQHAWGFDELKPISQQGQNNWGGMGMTILDSLDTLWIMGLKDEFYQAKKWVESSLRFDRIGSVSVFEITIRALGGLLAAFDLSKERIFLDKAKDLGSRLIKAFGTQSGIPTSQLNLATSSPSMGWSGSSAILSELGTLQVEFRYLAEKTGVRSFEDTAMRPLKLMANRNPANGLFPIKIRVDDGGFADNMITFGALGDSFYEYLLKLWLQGGKKETWLRTMYDKAMDGAINKLLMASTPSGLAFFSDWNGFSSFRKMDHLVCFVPGLLALGAYTDPEGLDSPRAQRDLKVAKAMMYTCREMYHRTQTGIAPEYVEFPSGRDMVPAPSAPFYILRPETAESLFILNQLTGDPIYRDWAWEIWQAIDKECRTNAGYGALRNVNNRGSGIDDRMESFFLAETIKYLYLAQDPDKPVDLMKVVFNTEAHPLTLLDDAHVPTNL